VEGHTGTEREAHDPLAENQGQEGCQRRRHHERHPNTVERAEHDTDSTADRVVAIAEAFLELALLEVRSSPPSPVRPGSGSG
jgi:hypothetical protein